jgi:hypothetical protein
MNGLRKADEHKRSVEFIKASITELSSANEASAEALNNIQTRQKKRFRLLGTETESIKWK